MFERLAQKLLSNFLSKYFTEESLAKNKVSASSQLGVWSGYVSLKDLELKKDVMNATFRRKGQPFEIVHCSLKHVEITIPWAKLSNPINSSAGSNKEDAVVVIVADGIHLLVRTRFEYYDLALREEEFRQRRKDLDEAGSFAKVTEETSSMSYTDMFKKRIAGGLLQEISDKLHIHIRDLHLRLEDTESDAANPFACGVTMESMHIQHDEEGSLSDGVISKISQINHFAVYWNSLEYGHGVPIENSVLHQTCSNDRASLTRALNFCIARRASVMASPSRNPSIPTHSYLLLPLDGRLNVNLSTTPNDLGLNPALEVLVTIDSVSTQIRDFQCIQILTLVSEVKNHLFVKTYRKFRPLVTVKENPRAWWLYAARVIRYQLKETFLRWSWSPLEEGYITRGRYMELYERKVRFPSKSQSETLSRLSSNVKESDILNRSRQPPALNNLDTGVLNKENGAAMQYAAPDEGAGPSIPSSQMRERKPLSQDELVELQGLEDGIQGGLSVSEILLYQALVNVRLGRTVNGNSRATNTSWWKSTVEDVARGDSEAKEDFDRLLLYLNKSSEQATTIDLTNRSQTAISVGLQFDEVRVAIFAPSHLTSDETQLRRLHEKFLDLTVLHICVDYSLKGDFATSDFQLSIFDLLGTEVRADGSQHIFAKQTLKGPPSPSYSGAAEAGINKDPLFVVTLAKNPPTGTSCDTELVALMNSIEIKLTPHCQWIARSKSFFKRITKLPSVANYWGDLSMAYVNSLALGRLGLLAKAESAAGKHKNRDIEITVQCPVLRIGDGNGCDIIIDLGVAHFKTERLAGVARSKLNHFAQFENINESSSDQLVTSIDEGSTMGSLTASAWTSRTPGTPRRRSDRHFLTSSALSIESRNQHWQGNRSVGGSYFFDDTMSFQRTDAMSVKKGRESDNLHALFYDVYQLRLNTGKITYSGDSEMIDLSMGFEVCTTFKKSVIPSDHTLCKLKARTVVGDLNFLFTERMILHIGKTITIWKSVLKVDTSQQSFTYDKPSSVKGFDQLISKRTSTKGVESSKASLDHDPAEEGSLSQIDESEFFDTNEGYDSVPEENHAIWFDDHFIADAESVISDSRSVPNERRGRRRQRSVSDVSTVSDQSIKGRRGQLGNYLSAENLAKLEEAASEDDSLPEIGMDDDSFHSVLSAGGQAELLRELKEDIENAEEKIKELTQKAPRSHSETLRVSLADQKQIRKEKRASKLELDRAHAELKSLRALQGDLVVLVSEAPDSNVGQIEAKNARSLLEARRRRDSMIEGIQSHNLTRNLNRELFQGSVLFNRLQITIDLEDADKESSKNQLGVFELIAAQTAVAVFHYANDTKVYFSLDQITAAVRSKVSSSAPTRLLFSGGSSDTLLPSHFPHLIPRSMEERFLRGTLDLGKRRAKTVKLRLVLGDIEILPFDEFLNPVASFLFNIDAALKSVSVEAHTNGFSNLVVNSKPDSSSDISGKAFTNNTLTCTPESEKPTKYYDLAVRFTSFRIVLSHSNQIIGACAISETSFRFILVSSHLKNRTQLDARCTNFQVLEISNLEAGRGSEILGRRDPYSALIYVRLRSQLVPSSESGGWVIGVENGRVENEPCQRNQAVQNVYVGVKISPLSLVASPDATSNLIESAREFKSIISKLNSSASHSSAHQQSSSKKGSFLKRISAKFIAALRWRFDVSLRRIELNFPEQENDEWNISDDIARSKMMLAFSVVTCLQESDTRRGCLSLEAALTDLSLVRVSDGWPILEPLSVTCHLCLERTLFERDIWSVSGVQTPQLEICADSPLNEITAVMHRYGWDSTPTRGDKNYHVSLRAKVTPVRVNCSAQIVGFLADVARPLKKVVTNRKRTERPMGGSATKTSLPPVARELRLIQLQVLFEYVDFQLLKEAESKPISFAEPLVSFALSDVTVDHEQGGQTTASILIRNSSLFDLSSARGVRVIGEDSGVHLVDNPYFVRVKLYMDDHLDSPKTIRLEVNWGRIQCLVLPSFLRSILSFKDDVKAILGVVGSKAPKTSGEDTLTRFLNLPKDTNLILSANAEAFECILSSRDIVEYVQKSDTYPIGVVSLRWKASLSVAIALDCLRRTSIPWLTLNLDGNFTDKDDASLFKDFVNRYLVQSSGFLAGSDEIGHKLINAFTARISLGVSHFQAIRTNISSRQLMLKSEVVGKSYKSAHRVWFSITPPSAGEQIITNPIDFDLVYRAVGASMSAVKDQKELVFPQVEISQLLQLNANFMNVLLYITKGTQGFTEAFRVTLKPILDLLKRKDGKRQKEDEAQSPNLEVDMTRPTMISMLRNASSMCTINLEGFQVTCVPGGATRLNESPIIKFELSRFTSGFAAVPVPKDVRLMAERSRARQESARHLLSGVDVMHLTAAGWIACEITAHYHNRRLVAWEPFIEPWVAEARFGADLVEAFHMSQTLKKNVGELKSKLEPHQAGLDNFNSGSQNEGKGDRLREFGRLFRAPFQSVQSSKPTQNETVVISQTDFCYLMLASTTRNTILSVLYPTSNNRQEKEAHLFSSLPGKNPMDWLYGFGNPQRESTDQYSVSCLLSDKVPLNINLTGALIENVLGYLDNIKQDGFRTVAPHWIRNDTGMVSLRESVHSTFRPMLELIYFHSWRHHLKTIRFQEVLDMDRVKRGEQAGKCTLANGSKVPLTLTRSLSQTCDPHRAYIYLELGSFEDTVGRIKHDAFDIPKGSRSTSFFFKAAAKIPVDTVGVHRYPLDRNAETRIEVKAPGTDSRALGWIIVRVALRGGIKVVSVESPFVLKSTADADLVCEVRQHNGLSLLWRCLVPKSEGQHNAKKQTGIVSVPADIVPFIHDGSYSFSVTALPREASLVHEAEFVPASLENAIEISTPPPFSPESFSKGLISEEEVALSTMSPQAANDFDAGQNKQEKVHLTMCSVRIGSSSGVKAAVEVPEQRMIFIRSPLVIRNFLALPIAVQVRVKLQSHIAAGGSSSSKFASSKLRDQTPSRRNTLLTDWEDLGVLDCGQSVNWTGAFSSDRVQLRVRFVGIDGDNSRRFPGWSSAVHIPAREMTARGNSRSGSDGNAFFRMRVSDANNVPLHLSVALEGGNNSNDGDPAVAENIRLFSETFGSGTRVVSVFVPYWIVDGTNEDLEFFSGAPIAGQPDNRLQSNGKIKGTKESGLGLGLAELLDNQNFLQIPSRSSFEVLMVGDESSTRLTVRKRLGRQNHTSGQRRTSPWSDPIPLQAGRNSQHDITVLAPHESSMLKSSDSDDPRGIERFVLRSNIVNVPERFGGKLGTKLIHVVNRYSIVNEIGRDIEIASDNERRTPVLVRAVGWPQPYHFDDSRPIRFRFKEFGWSWSGKFNIRLKRREVTMRLRHKMKGYTVIVTVEVLEKKKSSTSVLVFRQSSHPPFRLENHTMHPLHFGQSLGRVSSEDSDIDSMLLPYQSADFAWDEPEKRRRSLIVKSTSSNEILEDYVLGRFNLDRIAPGTELKLESTLFAGELVADGPTRVLRITDASMPRLPTFRQDELNHFQQKTDVATFLATSLLMRLTHGVGISVVDWSPQELLYFRLDDIYIERKIDTKKDTVNIAVGHIQLNNQLWVTPYPVLLKMGKRSESSSSRRRNRRHDAVSLSWRRALNTDGDYSNVTLLERVELSSEPIFVNVDGKLPGLLFRMIRQIAGIGLDVNRNLSPSSRDNELRKMLDLAEIDISADTTSQRKEFRTFEHDADGELMTTAAIAAKLKTRPLPLVTTIQSESYTGHSLPAARKDKNESLSKPQQKYYIEKLRISATKADLSWSGALPGLVSSILLRALTFERLPLRLRPYSSSHAYGNAKDHLQSLKYHYLSLWRIFDLLMGLSYNPTFLVRAFVYTFRESWASILDSWSNASTKTAQDLSSMLSTEAEFQPTFDDGLPFHEVMPRSLNLKQVTLGPFVNATAFLLGGSSSITAWMSSFVSYGAQSGGAHHLSTRGLVRSRNPRLFAHVDGKDLLVEYVEGENAGKALLSRVRMGMHLGEGYIFHTEGAKQPKIKFNAATELDSATSLILMVTSERVLLLDGKLDGDFCSVVWEAMFLNIVHVEVILAEDMMSFSSGRFFDQVIIWYLSDAEFAAGNAEDKTTKHAKALAAGIDVLHTKSVFVPHQAGKQFLAKMGGIDKRLLENSAGENKLKED